MTLRHLLALAVAPLLLVTACGDDDDGSALDAIADDEASADRSVPRDDEDAWPPPGRGFLPGTGDAGTVTVDGTEYPIDVIRECDVTDFFAGDDRTATRWVQGYGPEDPDSEFSDNAEINVYTYDHTNPVSVRHDVKWSGPEGIYDGSARETDDDALDFGDRITGAMSLRSALGNPPVDIEIDLVSPDGEPDECRS
jgi:hypothetical protein